MQRVFLRPAPKTPLPTISDKFVPVSTVNLGAVNLGARPDVRYAHPLLQKGADASSKHSIRYGARERFRSRSLLARATFTPDAGAHRFGL
jgi:hypothetical protein